MRRPVVDPRAARDRVECALVVDGGAAAHAAEQPRRRGRRTSRGPRRLRRQREGGALARSAQGDRPCAARARCRRDAARAVGQARRRVPDDGRRAARPDRELAARAEVGDMGRVPAARDGRPDDVRPDDGRIVDLHRHAGNPAGHLPDVRGCRREALRLPVARRPDRPHRRPGRDGRRPAARGDARRCGDPLRRGRSVPDRPPPRDALPRRGDGLAGGRARPGAGRRGVGPTRSRSACSGTRRTSCPSSRGAGSTSIS